MASRLKFATQFLPPRPSIIHGFPYYTRKIARNGNLPASECAYFVPSEPRHEVAKLQKDVLARPWLKFRCVLGAPYIVRRKKDDSKTDIGIRLDFLDDGSPFVGLLVQYNWFKSNTAQKAGHCFASLSVMTMNNKYSI